MTGSALRRLTFDEPVSRLAISAKRLAKISLPLALAALAAAHAQGAMARFFAAPPASQRRPRSRPRPVHLPGLAVAVAVVAMILVAAAAVSIWMRGRRGVPRFGAVMLVALLAPYPAWLALSRITPPGWPILPPIPTIRRHFRPRRTHSPLGAAGRRRRWPRNAAETGGRLSRREDNQPRHGARGGVQGDARGGDAIEMENPGRDPSGRTPPAGRPYRGAGAFDGARHSPALVSIRIRPVEGETRIDVRVVTRYLPSDLGAGAAMIGQFGDIVAG